MTTGAQGVTTSGEPAPVVEEAFLPPNVRRRHRRRRPTGAPPPLPRKIGTTGKGWLVLSAALLAWVAVATQYDGARRVTDRVDASLLRSIAQLRTAWLTDVFTRVHLIGSGWTVTVVGVGLIVVLIAFRRWRHLFTFVGSFALLQMVGGLLYGGFSRPRPYDVTTIGRWAGFSLPAPPVAVVTIIGIAIAYTVAVAGRPRTIAKAVMAVVVDLRRGGAVPRRLPPLRHPRRRGPGRRHPGHRLSVLHSQRGLPRRLSPGKDRPPRRERRRGEAIRRAVQDQFGLTVAEIKPVGLAGSGGSTPLRLRVAGDPDSYLFGKLCAMSHVRADRWYKLGRTILYGNLEDEAPFQSVRRLVEYEDYAVRLLRDVGIPTAAPSGWSR